jgi:hypothetical protein
MCSGMRSRRARRVRPLPEPHETRSDVASDLIAWAQKHWRILAAVFLALFLMWRFSGKRPDENGRYVLVKDDVPCEAQRDDDEGRRWCYLVLDTRSGRLEERVRKVGSKKRN